jgi:hypothetical protein
MLQGFIPETRKRVFSKMTQLVQKLFHNNDYLSITHSLPQSAFYTHPE